MKKQKENKPIGTLRRFCAAVALCALAVTALSAALPMVAASIALKRDMPRHGATEEMNTYSRERDGAVFRLHILANSDSEKDQAVKIAVRDAVLEYERECTGAASAFDAAEAESIIRTHGAGILQTVRETLEKNGAEYDAQLAVGKFDFPEKQYGEKIYPAGEYRALRILLGEARGKNWWCLMFPPLCIANLNGATIEDKGGGAETVQAERTDESQPEAECTENDSAQDAQERTGGGLHFKSLFAELWRSLFG